MYRATVGPRSATSKNNVKYALSILTPPPIILPIPHSAVV